MKNPLSRMLALVLTVACLLTFATACQSEETPDIQVSENSNTTSPSSTTSSSTEPSATTSTTASTTVTTAPTTSTTTEPTSPSTSGTTTTTTTGTTTKPTAGNAEARFDDTLFIGDSRTYGFVCYHIDVPGATFFCAESLNVYTVMKNTVDVPGVGKVTLEQLLKQKQFKQVYIMFGLNEIGSDYKTTVNKYKQVIDLVGETQPNAKFIIQSSLHVSKATSDKNLSKGKVFNNTRINALNELLKELVDNKTVFYVDINAKFDDQNGGLSTQYAAGDGMHVKVGAYSVWRDYLYANRIP